MKERRRIYKYTYGILLSVFQLIFSNGAENLFFYHYMYLQVIILIEHVIAVFTFQFEILYDINCKVELYAVMSTQSIQY
jgi:hypothetical protein